MMKNSCFYLFLIITLFVSCGHPHKDSDKTETDTGMGYNLSAPDRVYVLPKELKEISGITEIDTSKIACIQDEREIVFIYDLNSGRIIRRIDFGYRGDYEGIARVDSTLYILRSDGELTRIKNYKSDDFVRSAFTSGIPWKDNEGLCYDPDKNILLIISKETPGKSPENKDKRFIYGFNFFSDKLIQEPVYTINLSMIDSFALDNNIKVPMKDKKKSKKKEPDIKFLVSDIAIHPLTGRLFLLSSVDKLLFVFNMSNEKIEYIERLDPGLFIQPEGITFSKKGVLYISNEGKNKPATLLQFNYQPAAVVPPR